MGATNSRPFPSSSIPASGNGFVDSFLDMPDLAREDFLNFVSVDLDWSTGKTKHTQTYSAFLRAASLGVDAQLAYDAVVQCIIAAGGVLDPVQVRRQQCRAADYVAGNAGNVVLSRDINPKPVFSPAKLAEVAAKVSLPDPLGALRQWSIIPPETVTPAAFLDALYEPGERVIIFTDQKTQGQCVYEAGSSSAESTPIGGSEGVWYLIQPVDGNEHWNPRGKKFSRRSEEAVIAWRYLLLEADEADTGDWIRALVQLPLKIVAIYASGGRSVHALVRVDAGSKAGWDDIKAQLEPVVVTLGADHCALTAVRLSRLPNCRRGDRLQKLLYLNPGADGTPIIAIRNGEPDKGKTGGTQ